MTGIGKIGCLTASCSARMLSRNATNRRLLLQHFCSSLYSTTFCACFKKDIGDIPPDKIAWSFHKSSGAGGQNVNKVNTKAQVSVQIDDSWLTNEVIQHPALAPYMNKDGRLVLSSQEHRTQLQNRSAVLAKLERLLEKAHEPLKVRKQRTQGSRSKQAKQKDIEYKRRRSEVKKGRQKGGRYDGW